MFCMCKHVFFAHVCAYLHANMFCLRTFAHVYSRRGWNILNPVWAEICANIRNHAQILYANAVFELCLHLLAQCLHSVWATFAHLSKVQVYEWFARQFPCLRWVYARMMFVHACTLFAQFLLSVCQSLCRVCAQFKKYLRRVWTAFAYCLLIVCSGLCGGYLKKTLVTCENICHFCSLFTHVYACLSMFAHIVRKHKTCLRSVCASLCWFARVFAQGNLLMKVATLLPGLPPTRLEQDMQEW
jgi:hypothetical protein